MGLTGAEGGPFLPIPPTQILLDNLLYDVVQVTIPTDCVDRACTFFFVAHTVTTHLRLVDAVNRRIVVRLRT